ncbi:TonB family protein [Aestuariicella sp. G3-2]|uniref:TonB family protein n=1 Tax=Pseudomaricurvus albidus TaxID=2842452 RepID=UPI001C0D3D7F|nr:TonB family protein [Aestuariicella albida]MBU3070965.1 TonB family protein [Aestuariicella albida]
MSRPGFWALFALLVLGAPLTFADSLLNGLADHKQFNKDLFIGALYTDNLSADAASQLNNPGRRRLELRVVAKRLSSRQLNSMWIEGMAINNPPDLLTQQAENMVSFTSFVKRSLRAGDILAIRGDGTKTTVTLNDVELGSINSPKFFNMVLRTWIGSVPLSSEFRDALLTNGSIDGDLLAKFESISPSQGRRDAVAKWVQPAADIETELADAAPTQTALDDDNRPVAEITKPVVTAPSIAAPPKIEKPTLAASEPDTAETPQAKPEAPKVVKATETPTPAKPESKPAVAKAAASKADLPEEEELFDDEEDDSGPLLTAESLLSRQIYHSQLLKWTYQHIRYPQRAASRGQEGSVRIAVVIDRQGEVQSVSEVESSKYETLNREALRAVERSKPFPPMPDDIQGSEFAFSLPIQFRLPD